MFVKQPLKAIPKLLNGERFIYWDILTYQWGRRCVSFWILMNTGMRILFSFKTKQEADEMQWHHVRIQYVHKYCPHPLLCVAFIFGRSGSIGGLGAEWEVLLQCGLLVQRGVAHMFINRVDGHLCNVLRSLEESVTWNISFSIVLRIPGLDHS